jgi:hypothetical protein
MSDKMDAPEAEVLVIDDVDAAAWNEYAYEQGWSDGMPLVPPTESAVDAFLRTVHGDNEPLVALPPRMVFPSMRSLAANAVMAGCKPEYFPVIVACVRAIGVREFNLHGVLATTHPCNLTVIIQGPIRQKLFVNSGTNCFGQGWRANATIGRALGLITRNIGGAVPGETDRATHGSPAKYSFCFGENEEECPWEPYRVRQGFDRENSVVTVFASEPPHNINDHGSTDGKSLLLTCASVMSTAGANTMYGEGPMLLVIGPEHAETLFKDGWTIEGIQHHLFETALIPASEVSPENQVYYGDAGRVIVNNAYTITPKPEDLHIVVAGGPGKHSAWIPGLGPTIMSSVRINDLVDLT